MPIQDARPSPFVSGQTGSFRKQQPGGDVKERMAHIVEGNEKLVAEAVANLVVQGLAVMLSPSRDGGALCVRTWYGSNTTKDYVTTPEELEELCTALGAFKVAQPGQGLSRAVNGALRRS